MNSPNSKLLIFHFLINPFEQGLLRRFQVTAFLAEDAIKYSAVPSDRYQLGCRGLQLGSGDQGEELVSLLDPLICHHHGKPAHEVVYLENHLLNGAGACIDDELSVTTEHFACPRLDLEDAGCRVYFTPGGTRYVECTETESASGFGQRELARLTQVQATYRHWRVLDAARHVQFGAAPAD